MTVTHGLHAAEGGRAAVGQKGGEGAKDKAGQVQVRIRNYSIMLDFK